METLADIVRRYDVVLIQEIRDAANLAIFELVDRANEAAPGVRVVVPLGALAQ